MNFRTQRTVIPRRGIELASVKRTKLHFSHETDPSIASLPGVYTLNRVVDCFNAACLHCVKNNKLLSYSAITPVLCSAAERAGPQAILMLLPLIPTERAQQWAMCDCYG